MKFPFFASFIVFCIWLSHQLKKSRKLQEKKEKSFWDLENQANNTRRKSLANLNYITIPLESFPMELSALPNEATISPQGKALLAECMETLQSLSTVKIVNFTGLTNTELKLQYGAPNINLLMEFDQNYTLLARTLQTFAEELFKAGLVSEAKTVLEFAISTHTDVSQSYFLLADIYEREHQPEKIEALITVAESLNTVMKKSIVRTLQESGPYSGLLRSS